jgi:hypothetical protein
MHAPLSQPQMSHSIQAGRLGFIVITGLQISLSRDPGTPMGSEECQLIILYKCQIDIKIPHVGREQDNLPLEVDAIYF